MESKQVKILINDFSLLYETVKTVSKMSGGVKFSIGDCGLTIYAKNDYSKCELTSNCITTTEDVSFCLGDLGSFLKILTTVRGIYDGDYSQVSISYDAPFLKISSRKFKTKISTVNEDRIVNFLGTKVHTTLTPKVEFTTSNSAIKSVNGHSFICNDTQTPRIYLETDDDMENNMIFARIGNDENDLANSITLELGMLNSGTLGDSRVILDFNRLNILNMIPMEEIHVHLANERPVLCSSSKITGKNGTFLNLSLYVFMMVR